jgi:hypothetical protein
MYRRIALLVLLTASVPQAKAEPPDEQALRLLNHYRQLAGLTTVKLDRNLSAGCMEHANYMAQNSSLSRPFPMCFHHHSIDVVHGVEIQVIAMIGVMMLIPDVTDLVRAVAIDRHIRQQFVALPVI